MIQTLERPHTFSMSAMLSVNSPAGCETVREVTVIIDDSETEGAPAWRRGPSVTLRYDQALIRLLSC